MMVRHAADQTAAPQYYRRQQDSGVPRVLRPAVPGFRVRELYPVWLGQMRITGGQLPLLPEDPSGLAVLDTRARGAEFLDLPVRRVLNPPSATHMPFWSINPYVGCEFGCSYCYARRTHEWTMERAGMDRGAETPHESFERHILVKHGAPEVLLRTLEPGRLAGTELVIGTATDPYQPAEKEFRLTRRLLEALLLHRGLRLGIISKSPLIVRDIDVLRTLSERHELSIYVSIASADPLMLRRLEARSPAPHARLRALARLRAAGIQAGLLIAPILPGITDSWASLAHLMEKGKEAGACWVSGGALRLGPAARNGFLPLLRQEFPELVTRYERAYGNRQHAGKDYEKALARRIRTLQEAFGFPTISRRDGDRQA
jgi:DNA repair photolyase